MKYCISKYPKGSLPKQQTEGKYIDGYLYENLKVMAKNIKNDLTFLGVVYSSTLEVGTGKSVFAQHMGEAYTELVNEIHGLNVPFDIEHIVFTPKDLIERSFKVPRYSCIILDEWEDTHYWSELGMALRQFFRKCRQLNLFMIIIIPNFFQLNSSYAISRSLFAVDVKFEGEFERGYYSFYNFDKKKDLYIMGKKTMNYKCVPPNFNGRFTDGYAVGREEYLKRKREDLARHDEDKQKEVLDPKNIRLETRNEIIMNFDKALKQLGIHILQKHLAYAFGMKDSNYRLITSGGWKKDYLGPTQSAGVHIISPIIDDESFQETGEGGQEENVP